MSNEMQLKLIEIYLTDREAVTIYLFVGRYLKMSKIQDIHDFAHHFLLDCFPNLTSYQKFNNRLNILYPIFYDISLHILSNHIPENAQRHTQLIDSLPIVTCKGRNRRAKVARDCVDKGFCATKNMYCYGLKLHLPAFRRKGTLPFPNKIHFSAASGNDLAVVRERNRLDSLFETEVFADKIYIDGDCFNPREKFIQLDLIYTCQSTQRYARLPQTARLGC